MRLYKTLGIISKIVSYVLVIILISGLIIGYWRHFSDGARGIILYDYSPVVVVSGSMEPTIKVNAWIVLEYCDIDSVDVGDIIVYDFSGMNICHRVIDIEQYDDIGTVLYTQGDNNDDSDGIMITENMFRGKVTAILNGASVITDWFVNDDMTINRFRLTFLLVFVVLLGSLLLAGLKQFIKIFILVNSNLIVYNIDKGDKYIKLYKSLVMKYTDHNITLIEKVILSAISIFYNSGI